MLKPAAAALLLPLLLVAMLPARGAVAPIVSCPDLEGYTVAPNLDVTGHTLSSLGGADLRAAYDACEADDGCKGFNSNGDTKSAVQPASASSGVCLYMKIPIVVCKWRGGYIATAGADHPGDTMQGGYDSTDAAMEACDMDDHCKGFNSLGETKTATSPLNISRSTCFYIKINSVCPYMPGYQTIWDSDHPGDTLPSTYMTLSQARYGCTTDPGCTGFNSKLETKAAYSPLFTSRRTCFYVKLSTCTYSCPAEKGYVAYNFEHAGDVLDTSASVTDAKSLCDGNPSCLGYNSLAEMKSALSPLTSGAAGGACVYRKILTSCQALPGYSVHADYSHVGHQLTTSGDIQTLFGDCEADPACNGFIYTGTTRETKSAMLPLTYSRGACAYIKIKSSGCKAVPGYAALLDSDVQAHDITTITATAGRLGAYHAACNRDPSCVGYNTKGATKSSVADIVYARGVCLYIRRLPTQCITLPGGYTAVPDVAVAASSKNYSFVPEAKAACSVSADCEGFSYSPYYGNVSLLMAQSGTIVTSLGSCLYKKNETITCPVIAGYTATPDTTLMTPPIEKHPNATSAQYACWSDATCVGFSSLNWATKRAYSFPTGGFVRYVFGACYYTKNYVDHCSAAVDPSVSCTNLPDGYSESCRSDYENYNNITRKCSDVNECASADVSVNCTNAPGSFFEVCKAGYQNYNNVSRKCADTNECATVDPSVNCTNTDGGFNEVCMNGYENYDSVTRKCSAVTTQQQPYQIYNDMKIDHGQCGVYAANTEGEAKSVCDGQPGSAVTGFCLYSSNGDYSTSNFDYGSCLVDAPGVTTYVNDPSYRAYVNHFINTGEQSCNVNYAADGTEARATCDSQPAGAGCMYRYGGMYALTSDMTTCLLDVQNDVTYIKAV